MGMIQPYKPISPVGSPEFPMGAGSSGLLSLQPQWGPQSPQRPQLGPPPQFGQPSQLGQPPKQVGQSTLAARESLKRESRALGPRPKRQLNRQAVLDAALKLLPQLMGGAPGGGQRPQQPGMEMPQMPQPPTFESFGDWNSRNYPKFAGRAVPKAFASSAFNQYKAEMAARGQTYRSQMLSIQTQLQAARYMAQAQDRGRSNPAANMRALLSLHGAMAPGGQEYPKTTQAAGVRSLGPNPSTEDILGLHRQLNPPTVGTPFQEYSKLRRAENILAGKTPTSADFTRDYKAFSQKSEQFNDADRQLLRVAIPLIESLGGQAFTAAQIKERIDSIHGDGVTDAFRSTFRRLLGLRTGAPTLDRYRGASEQETIQNILQALSKNEIPKGEATQALNDLGIGPAATQSQKQKGPSLLPTSVR